MRFGGIERQSRNFDQFQTIDGIMGLAYKSMGFDSSPFARVVEQHPSVPNVIQTCLTHEGGLLLLGEDPAMDQDFYLGQLTYTPITLDAWYTVNATGLWVGQKKMDLSLLQLNGPFPSDPCIVDSGTNFLSLTTPAFQAVKGALLAQCGSVKLRGICGAPRGQSLFDGAAYTLSREELSLFPEIEIRLVGDRGGNEVKLPLSPEDYLVPIDGKYRMGVTEGDCIIGNTHMIRYWTVYDVANSRIGFAPANRTKCQAERAKRMGAGPGHAGGGLAQLL